MRKSIKITESQAKRLLGKIVNEQYHNVGGDGAGVGKSFNADEMAEQIKPTNPQLKGQIPLEPPKPPLKGQNPLKSTNPQLKGQNPLKPTNPQLKGQNPLITAEGETDEQYNPYGGQGGSGMGQSLSQSKPPAANTATQTPNNFRFYNAPTDNTYKSTPALSVPKDITTRDGKYIIKLSDKDNVMMIQRALLSIAQTKNSSGSPQFPEIVSALSKYVKGSGVDGIYGGGTRTAVALAQKSAGLPQTGYVNGATAKYLMQNATTSLAAPIRIKSMFVTNPNYQAPAPQPAAREYTPMEKLPEKPLSPIQEEIKRQIELFKK